MRPRFLPNPDWAKYRVTLANPHAFSRDTWIGLSAFLSSVEAQRILILRQSPLSNVPDEAHVKPALQLAADLYRTISGRPQATVNDP